MRIAIVAAALLSACAGGAQPPNWQSQSHAALERFRQQYLEGDTRKAERSFAESKAALASTGKPELAARLELVRCALGTAALDVEACLGFESVRGDATVAEQAYGDFVSGRLDERDTPKLPSQYRAVASARDDVARNKAMQQIADPVSRLVAAGALFRLAQLSPDGLSAAIETASEQGYRRPLLAYLSVQARLAQSAGDTAALQSIQKRIELVYRSLPATK